MSIGMDENGLGFVPLQERKPHTSECRVSSFVQIKPHTELAIVPLRGRGIGLINIWRLLSGEQASLLLCYWLVPPPAPRPPFFFYL
jgi:hypothetical protein